MPNAIHAAWLFLINAIFDFYIFILMARLIMVFTGINYFNPVVQFIVKLTQFIVNPLRRLIPNVGRLELASLVLILVIEAIKFLLVSLVTVGVPSLFGIILLVIGDTLGMLINFFFYAILLQVILSWIQPDSPMNGMLNQIISPIMRPIQRLVPTVGGFDISPIPALLLLHLLTILLVSPLMVMGMNAAFS